MPNMPTRTLSIALRAATLLFALPALALAQTFVTVRPADMAYSPDEPPLARVLPGQEVALPLAGHSYVLRLVRKTQGPEEEAYRLRRFEMRSEGAASHFVQGTRSPELLVSFSGLEDVEVRDAGFGALLELLVNRQHGGRLVVRLTTLKTGTNATGPDAASAP